MSAPWWRSAAVYQVYPRSFRDRNGDGTGDLRGIIAELPYLASLHVDAVWLSPFYPSPQRDSGYDVADPRAVDPMYGTLDDARELFDRAHALGLRVIVDVVPNHSSSEREWFRQALAAAPGSPERARYHFLDGRGADGDEPPTNWVSWFGGGAWTRITEPDGSPGQWYLHQFDSSQPDLNWSNPEVVQDGLETLRFWLDLGADGFRVDVALGLAKDMTYPDLDDPEALISAMRMDLDDGSEAAMERRRRVANSAILDRDEVQEIYRGWRLLMDSYDRDVMAVAEAWVPPERAARYVAPDTLHQIFTFDFMAAPWDPDRLKAVIEATVEGLRATRAPATWALSNHDSPRVVSRLGGGEEGLRRARALALIAHALPGSVYVYQGEELGLADVDLADDVRQDPVFFRTGGAQKGRDAARVPIPWRGSSAPYGFGSNADTWLPMPEGWARLTVEAENRDPTSTLNQYRSMLRLRQELVDLDDGGLIVEVHPGGILVIRRGARFACVVNCGADSHRSPVNGDVVVSSDGRNGRDMVEGGSLLLPPSTGVWVLT